MEAVNLAVAGRLYCCTARLTARGSPPIELLWRHFRRDVPHCKLFVSADALLKATHASYDRDNRDSERV
jgi:putative transposase